GLATLGDESPIGLRDAIAVGVAAIELDGEPAAFTIAKGLAERAEGGEPRSKGIATLVVKEGAILIKGVDVVRARVTVGVLDPGGGLGERRVEGLVVHEAEARGRAPSFGEPFARRRWGRPRAGSFAAAGGR